MLRKFKISIDGTQYLVEMEEIGAPVATPADAAASSAAASNAPAAPAVAPAPAPAPAPEPEPAAAAAPVSDGVPEGAHEQAAPMPGKILDIHVHIGDAVEVNQPVMVLEAMKMESQIVAEVAGTIASINVASGQMVNPGDLLFSINVA